MRKLIFLFLILSLIFISVNGFAKTVNLDNYLKLFYDNGEYKKCYDLTRVISKGHYNHYAFNPYGIKYNDNNQYTSSELKYYELHSLKHINPDAFNYNYMIQNESMLKYFSKDEVYPQFLKWADSLYNLPIIDEGVILMNNYVSSKPKEIDDIKEIKYDVRLRFRLNEIYKFLSKTDTISRDNIFTVNNSDMLNFMSNYKNVNLLNLYTPDFDYRSCWVHASAGNTDIQSNAYIFFIEVCKKNRFVNEKQISDYLYKNNLTKEQKIFTTFYFFSAFLQYAQKSTTGFTEYSNIEKIILYKTTVCNGYSNIFRHFLIKNNIECYKIRFSTFDFDHASNIIVINNKAYYVDLTWGLYLKEIKSFKNTVIKTPGFDERIINYDNIKNLNFVIEFYDNDYNSTKNRIINIIKKGS